MIFETFDDAINWRRFITRRWRWVSDVSVVLRVC